VSVFVFIGFLSSCSGLCVFYLKTHTGENIWQVQIKTQRKGKTPLKIRGYLIIVAGDKLLSFQPETALSMCRPPTYNNSKSFIGPKILAQNKPSLSGLKVR
jgi:outer membrane protein assembly factor BamB